MERMRDIHTPLGITVLEMLGKLMYELKFKAITL